MVYDFFPAVTCLRPMRLSSNTLENDTLDPNSLDASSHINTANVHAMPLHRPSEKHLSDFLFKFPNNIQELIKLANQNLLFSNFLLDWLIML